VGAAVPAGTQGVLRRQHQDRAASKEGRSASPSTPSPPGGRSRLGSDDRWRPCRSDDSGVRL